MKFGKVNKLCRCREIVFVVRQAYFIVLRQVIFEKYISQTIKSRIMLISAVSVCISIFKIHFVVLISHYFGATNGISEKFNIGAPPSFKQILISITILLSQLPPCAS
ncbi:Hypothetical_protein [Hexamita inflata]|uniref:Hypothetical_protein n=1 Tax=Hexamita inflata TaxID=28002 RepID=A0ABP1JS01_9EUKA